MMRTANMHVPARKSKAWFNHHNKTKLAGKMCQSCRTGRHDCRSMHCACTRCGEIVIKED